ncbi:Tim44/TimA family putative adaptor protein [Kozakia baliensis]|uniref:Tim44/TimA family putative adaptor protein n=1 Tax=Kozakia baliensis TaxID=153496 RepID=UPI000497AEC9|nr:Tim44/TimA family putative adaptor protein [Kozakia baliensis]AOX19340.1 hypothetical protein A0U90_02465 [Kozakia baliensis]
MSALSHIPYDIIVFALISLVLAWRLRHILGRRVGVESMAALQQRTPQPVATVAQEPPAATEPDAKLDVPSPGTRVGQILAQISTVQPGFQPEGFLRNAKTAFRDIVTAFALGERDKLRALLTDSAYNSFVAAIDAREAAHEEQRTEIVGINSLSIVDAVLNQPAAGVPQAAIEVQIVSRQISILNDIESQPLVGTESVTEFSDLWRFESLVGSNVPGAKWRLAAARAA